jgi:hypothetical protein
MIYNILQRYSDNGDDTLGLLFTGEQYNLGLMGYTLEDEKRLIKVGGETRIPAGTYDLELRKVESRLTLKYRKLYDFFTWHIQIMRVPNFNYVYVHIGNDDEDTDACVLIGDGANNNMIAPGFISNSTIAYQRWYAMTRDYLEAGNQSHIEIRDEDWIVRPQSREKNHV